MGYLIGCRKRGCNEATPCGSCTRRAMKGELPKEAYEAGGTMHSTSFKERAQRDDPSVVNVYFNAGSVDGPSHGHVQYRENSDGSTEYLYARDVEGTEYDV